MAVATQGTASGELQRAPASRCRTTRAARARTRAHDGSRLQQVQWRSGSSSILASAAATSWERGKQPTPSCRSPVTLLRRGEVRRKPRPEILRERIVRKFIEAFNDAKQRQASRVRQAVASDGFVAAGGAGPSFEGQFKIILQSDLGGAGLPRLVLLAWRRRLGAAVLGQRQRQPRFPPTGARGRRTE